MNDNPVNSDPRRNRRVTAEQSLNEALSSLEEILERGHDAEERSGGAAPAPQRPRPESAPSDEPRRAADDRGGKGPGNESGHGQYAIPLLHDVVMPGAERPVADAAVEDARDDDAQACRQFVERLANEIEVIVQARMEAAVQEAAEDIREQVRNHLDIMLPEILEELLQLGRRARD